DKQRKRQVQVAQSQRPVEMAALWNASEPGSESADALHSGRFVIGKSKKSLPPRTPSAPRLIDGLSAGTKHGQSHQQLGTRNQELGTGNRQPGTANRDKLTRLSPRGSAAERPSQSQPLDTAELFLKQKTTRLSPRGSAAERPSQSAVWKTAEL